MNPQLRAWDPVAEATSGPPHRCLVKQTLAYLGSQLHTLLGMGAWMMPEAALHPGMLLPEQQTVSRTYCMRGT